jgi:hypothetical protein
LTDFCLPNGASSQQNKYIGTYIREEKGEMFLTKFFDELKKAPFFNIPTYIFVVRVGIKALKEVDYHHARFFVVEHTRTG